MLKKPPAVTASSIRLLLVIHHHSYLAAKVLFAEQGTKEQLLATLRSVREQAEQTLAEHKALAVDLVQTGGPFPDRLHINELVFKFMWEQTETVIRWATWAEREVAGWPDNIARAEALEAGGFLRKAAGVPS